MLTDLLQKDGDDYFYHMLDEESLAWIKDFGFELISSTLDAYKFVTGSAIELDLLHRLNQDSSINVDEFRLMMH